MANLRIEVLQDIIPQGERRPTPNLAPGGWFHQQCVMCDSVQCTVYNVHCELWTPGDIYVHISIVFNCRC